MPRNIDAVDVRVGQRVRAYRLGRGMSQSTLGDKIGVTYQQVQKYEHGVNRIGSGRLKMIATVLGTTVTALFGEDENSRDTAVDRLLTDVLSQPYAMRMLRAFDGVKDPKQRRALVVLLEEMGRDAR